MNLINILMYYFIATAAGAAIALVGHSTMMMNDKREYWVERHSALVPFYAQCVGVCLLMIVIVLGIVLWKIRYVL